MTGELAALYRLTRELADAIRAGKKITLALQMLKTILACNAVNTREEVVKTKTQLTVIAKILAGPVKKGMPMPFLEK